jgi:hypothetical protein
VGVNGREAKIELWAVPAGPRMAVRIVAVTNGFGHWLLVIGYWLLVTGYWSLVTSE